jgi:hypothetical protein
MADEGARYRFGPRERGGALAGLRAGQILTMAAGLVAGVVTLRWQPDVAGVAVAFVTLTVCVALATYPLDGRTGEQWLPVVVLWSTRSFGPRGRRRMGALRGLRLLRAEWRDMGVVHDHRARTLTAALSVRGRSFALLGPDEQDRRVAGWSAVLAALARDGSPIHRVQWSAASFPDQGHGVRDHLATHAAPASASAPRRSYEELLNDMDADACTHEVILAVQIRQQRSTELGADALQREISSLIRLLVDADVVVDGVLSADELAQVFARTYEPHHGPDSTSSAAVWPWPTAMREEWAMVRVDGMVHATFWVAEWPRIEVRSDFLAPLLLGSARATLSVTMEALPPDQALRKVEASRTADIADSELRRRSGFVSTARHARQSEVLARREAELADGHASFRYAGYITVSAPSESELALACDSVTYAAGQSRLVLRRLYGDQASAYTCTLPLCRGLA